MIILVLGMPSWLMGASCQSSTVKVNGETYKPKSDREQVLLNQAKAAEETQDKAAETTAWQNLLKEFPDSKATPLAQRRLGELAYGQGRWADAAGYFESTLKGSNLVGAERAKIRVKHGNALLKMGQPKEAIKAFEDAYPNLPEEEQKKLSSAILRAAKQSGDQRALIQWQARLLSGLPADQQAEAKASLLQAIDGRLSSAELEVIYAKRGESLNFPYDYVAMRLALLYYHQQEFKACDEILTVLLGGLSKEHVLYPKLRELRSLRRQDASVQPKVIGVLYPKTGFGASVGRLVRNAVELATRRLEGKLRIVYQDTASNSATAVKGLEALVREHRVIAVFGPILSSTSEAVAIRAQELRVPLFSISLKEGLADIGDFVFRNNLTFSEMGTAIARYAVKKLSLSRFAVFYPQNEPGKAKVGAFWKEVERLGGKVVGAESYAQDTTSFVEPAERLVGRKHLGMRPLWYKFSRKIRETKSGFRRKRLYRDMVKQFPPVIDFDAIFIPDSFQYVSMIAPTLAQQDIEVKLHYRYWEKQVEERYKNLNKPLKFVQLLGGNGWNNEDIFLREPRHVVGSIFTVRYFPWGAKKATHTRTFMDEYRSAYPGQFDPNNPKPPHHLTAYTYDTVQIMVHIVDKHAPTTREKFRDALRGKGGFPGVKSFPGVTGSITIQENGEATAPIKFLVAHKDKRFKLHGTSADLE
ncbi:MAG: ABC transporter substrate-binding protein [Myxococcales bacterium]|nr:ABC transporter substrate-binding protein [Myxococcales bacterium]